MDKVKEKFNFGNFFNKYGIYVVLLLMVAASAIASPNFFTLKNILNVLRQSAPTIILAFGAMFLMISGNMDLSVGAGMTASGIGALVVYTSTGNLLVGLLAGILIGVAFSVISGLVVAYLLVPSFIVTLAMDLIIRGLVMVYTGGQTITKTGNFSCIGQGYLWIFPIPVIIIVVFTAVSSFVLRKTTMGRRFYAIGGNSEASKAAGINVKKTVVISYIVSGTLTAAAGIILISRINSGAPTAGEGYALDCVHNRIHAMGISITFTCSLDDYFTALEKTINDPNQLKIVIRP